MVEEFGSKQPMAVRNQVYAAMYEEVLGAVNKGQPAAGGLPSHRMHATASEQAPPCEGASRTSALLRAV